MRTSQKKLQINFLVFGIIKHQVLSFDFMAPSSSIMHLPETMNLGWLEAVGVCAKTPTSQLFAKLFTDFFTCRYITSQICTNLLVQLDLVLMVPSQKLPGG